MPFNPLRKNKEQDSAKKKIKTAVLQAAPAVQESRPEPVDFTAPSLVKELLPAERAEGLAADDYMVEVGGTAVLRRYYRSFFAEIMSGNTWGGMLDDLARGNFGDGDVDIAIHVRPSSSDVELELLSRRLRGLMSDLAFEGDPSKIDAIRDEISDIKARQKKLRMEIERSFKTTIQVIATERLQDVLQRTC